MPCKHRPVRGIYFRTMYQASEEWQADCGRWAFYKGSHIPSECISGGQLFICRKCGLVYAEPTKVLIKDGDWQELFDEIDDMEEQ